MNDTITHDSNTNIWCVIPVYNNAGTIKDVAVNCLKHIDNVLIIDDGSTDADISDLLMDTKAKVLIHARNRGKGAALTTALHHLEKHNCTHMITIDGDGQHLPDDIEKFIPVINKHKNDIVIGCRDFENENVPGKSKFGRGFSNMWVKIETGFSLRDTQSGFRSYPVKHLSQLSMHANKYDFEIEVLSRAAWAGIRFREVDIGVRYQDDRVSSFHPFKSNLNISLMHTRLVGRRLLPWPHRQLVKHKTTKGIIYFLKHPTKFINMLLKENATPAGLAASAAVGTVLGVIPIPGFHTVAIIYVTARLHLNKVMAATIQILYSPPFSPFLCIELGHYMQHGKWWTDFAWKSIISSLHLRLYDWLIGSLVLAPVFAIIVATAVYSAAASIDKKKRGDQNKSAQKKRGNALSLWFFKASLAVFGLRGAYGLLYPVCFYYLIFDRTAVNGAMAYISRRYPDKCKLLLYHHVFMLFVSQGKQLIDRHASLSGHVDFEFDIVGQEHAANLAREAQNGMILLTSHMGNWQLAISTLSSFDKDVYLVMLPEHNEALKKVLKIRKDNDHIKIISPEAHLGGIVEIMNVLKEGHIVSLMGDRAYGFESMEVDFLGEKANLPYGPFKIAAAAQCPVLFLFSKKTGIKSYQVDISKSISPSHIDRKNKRKEINGWLQNYADLLSDYISENPRQCFLFHDIWKKDTDGTD